MHSYHYRIYTGPTAVGEVASRLRDAAMPWQALTLEGTEHVHVSVDALHADAALSEMKSWPTRAGLPGYTFEFLRRSDLRCGYTETSQSGGRECIRRCVRPMGHNDPANESDMKGHAFDSWILR